MDQMLSPGFSIPSIGTPLHQMEADQQIVATNNNVYHPPVSSAANMDLANSSNNGSAVDATSNLFQSDSLNQIMGGDTGTMSIAQKQMCTFQDSFQTNSSTTQNSNERTEDSSLITKSTAASTNSTLTTSNSSSNGNNNNNTTASNAPQSLMQPQTPVSFLYSNF